MIMIFTPMFGTLMIASLPVIILSVVFSQISQNKGQDKMYIWWGDIAIKFWYVLAISSALLILSFFVFDPLMNIISDLLK